MCESDSSEDDKEARLVPQDTVKRLVKQILIALKDMHAANIWHRDVKPDNIRLDEQGSVKFVDFNISKVLDE